VVTGLERLPEVETDSRPLPPEHRARPVPGDDQKARKPPAWPDLRNLQNLPNAPNCNAYAERFVRSAKEECLERIVPLGERHLRRTLQEFAAHDHCERNRQGLANELVERSPPQRVTGAVRHRQRVGGILNFYYRPAA
jgi:hypothetical protein